MKIKKSDYTVIDMIKSNGAETKIWVEIDNRKYLVKFPIYTCSKGKSLWWTNVESEHYASKFINITGGNAHKTTLVESFECPDGKVLMAVLCESFLRLGDELITFNENSSSIDTNVNKHEYFLNDIKYVLKKTHNLNFSYIEPYFYEMYIYDAILGNFDRHSGNWGVIKK